VIAYVDRGVLGYLEKYLEGIFHFDSVPVQLHDNGFPDSLCHRVGDRGVAHGPLGHPQGLRAGHRALEPGRHDAGRGTGVWTFCFAMFFLGLGEAANFPACNKTVAEWFPKRNAPWPSGIFNSGATSATSPFRWWCRLWCSPLGGAPLSSWWARWVSSGSVSGS